jgi:cell division protein ZapA
LKRAQEQLESLKEEKQRLKQENASLAGQNETLRLELAKREAELGEVRNTLDKATRP